MNLPTRAVARPLNLVVLTEVLILGGIATLFLSRWLRGQLDYYIHPRYSMLVIVTSLVLLLMAAAHLRSVYRGNTQRKPSWIYLLLAVPLLFGVLVPARPLGADTLAGRGLELNLVAEGGRSATLSSDTTTWNLLDWGTTLSMRGEDLYASPADVLGFVFLDERLGPDAFYVVRFVVTCCAADGAAVGLPVIWPDGASLTVNSWVRVQGSVDEAILAEVRQPALHATSVEPVPQPASPYLYP